MTDSYLMDVKQVQKALDIGEGMAYKIIREINTELDSKGFITIRGRVPRKALFERLYLSDVSDRGNDA